MIKKITNLCTGCLACQAICPVQAISQQKDRFGFWVPQIDSEKCIECKKCIIDCPQNHTLSMNHPVACFAVKAKENTLLSSCSSGGAFGVIAEKAIEESRHVGGCSGNSLHHYVETLVSTKDDLKKLYGSKYVQSSTDSFILDLKQLLDGGEKVTVCGTPCQIAGIRTALGDSEELVLIDFVCHGVSSPVLLSNYIKTYEKMNDCIINDIEFRNKDITRWGTFCAAIKTNNGTRYVKASSDPYYYCFLNSYSYADACYDCKYSQQDRVSDITIGDAWGCKDYCSKEFNSFINKGVSLVIINTEKGKNVWDSIKNRFVFESVNYEIVSKYNRNLVAPSSRPVDAFYDHDIDDDKYYYNKMVSLIPYKEKLKALIPIKLIETIKEWRRIINNG